MSIRWKLAAAAVAVIQMPAIAVAAHPTTPASPVTEEIVVTASPLGASELHLAQPVTVLSGVALENRMSSSIGETLSHELGVASTAFGAAASRPVIRGQGGSRVRLLESGISSMDVSNLSPDHAVSIEPLVATQIEILKGPATLLYGSGASGGVVNVVTNRIPERLPDAIGGRVQADYNSVSDQRAGAFTGDAGIGPLALHLDGSARRADDYDIPGFGNLVPEPGERYGTLRNSDLETASINGGASYIGGDGYLGFDIGHYDTDYGVPGEGARIKLNRLRYDIKGEIRTPLGLDLIEKARIQLGHVDYEHREIEPNGQLGTTFVNDEYEGRIELVHVPIADWHGALGVQIGRRDFSAIGDESLTPPLQLDAQGVFVVEERDLGRDWHVELGSRVEHQRISPKDRTPATDHIVYSLSAGAIRRFDADRSLALYFSRAQRAPSLEELYNHGPHEATATYETGAIDLDAETANNLDLVLRHGLGAWTWQLNLFGNYSEDYIFGQEVANAGGGVQRVDDDGVFTTDEDALLLINYTQHDALFYGIEAGSTLALARAAWGELDGRVSLDYVRGKLTNGDNLPRMTPLRLGAGLDYRRGRWTGVVDVFHVFTQDTTARLESDTDGYTLLEAALNYAFSVAGNDYQMSLRGRNLLDQDARVHTSFLKDVAPLPGRAVMVSVQAAF